ncbi:MAG: YggS family pyridoxal phosphate-dependent enzyme, partial [Gammaproteobacteria bacterium]
MTSIRDNLIRVHRRIRLAEDAALRPPGSVGLLAVSKTKPAGDLAAAYRAGQRHFGESYLQEALDKQRQLAHYNITWHFIGPIQSNKTRHIASNFSWVHSVDRMKIASRLSEQRPDDLSPLNICLQINISGERSKSGIALDELSGLADEIGRLPRLRLRGVMAIPQAFQDFESQRTPYRQIYQAAAALKTHAIDTFSFGMSGDLEAAVMEGATVVRIGTAIFG